MLDVMEDMGKPQNLEDKMNSCNVSQGGQKTQIN